MNSSNFTTVLLRVRKYVNYFHKIIK